MKKYISADLRVINCANDVIATSGPDKINAAYHSGDATLSGSRLDFDDDEFDY